SERARARCLLDLLAHAGADAPEQKALAQPLRLDEIQRMLLDDKTALLEYSLGDDSSFLWLVTETGVEGHLLPKRPEIEAPAQRIFEFLTPTNGGCSTKRR